MKQSTAKRRQSKPKKPSKNFPMFPHASGRWCKKHRGRFYYFGSWDDPKAALERFSREWPFILEGRTPPPVGDEGLRLGECCNHFLTSKRHLLDNGEITLRTFQVYHRSCQRLIDAFGRERRVDDLRPADFDALRATLAKGRGPQALSNEVRNVRILFKYAYDAALIDRPLRFGPTFKQPSKRVLRKARQQSGKRMLEAGELQQVIKTVRQPLRAMVLLGINGGLGQSDIANMPQSSVDLENGWIDYPRPKTGIERRIPLWPVTVYSLREAIDQRPQPKDEADSNLCFVTKYGNRFVRTSEKGSQIDGVALQFAKLLRDLKIKRPGLNFYALRHTFQTIAEESRDLPAIRHIMGHADDTMAAVYREHISDERLIAVTDTVRHWLWSDGPNS